MDKNQNSFRETFAYTLINYFGIALGIGATLFLYPKNKELIGEYRFVEGLAHILYPFFLLGGSQALVNYYPELSAKLRERLFAYSVYTIIIVGIIVFFGLLIFNQIPYFDKVENIYYAFSMAFFLAFIDIFKKRASILQKITLPTLFDIIIPKLALPAIFGLVIYNRISLHYSLWIFVLAYALVFLLIGIYLYRYFKTFTYLNFNDLFSVLDKSEYKKFSFYAFIGGLGAVIAFRIDSIMIPMFLTMTDNGNYSIGVTLVSALSIPAAGLFSIYAPVISAHLKDGNLVELNKKYKEISIFLFFIGSLIYSCLFLGIENLFLLLPTGKSLLATIPVILILGFNILINMGTGFNNEIITYSNYYRFNLVAIIILVVLNVCLNVLFLSVLKLGVTYVAVASLISMAMYNFIKLWYIYKKFGLFPFDYRYLILVITSSSIIFFVSFIPDTITIFFNLIAKVSLCLLLNFVLIYRLRLVKQFNELLDRFLVKSKP